MQSQLVAAV
jgi:hypothetical protein